MDFTTDIGKPWRFEEDGLTVTRACAWSAPGCHPTACGIKYYTDKEGNLVKVEGGREQPHHPRHAVRAVPDAQGTPPTTRSASCIR